MLLPNMDETADTASPEAPEEPGLLVAVRFNEAGFVTFAADFAEEGELKTSVRAVVFVVVCKSFKRHCNYLLYFSGLLHFIQTPETGGCSVLHFGLGQTTTSLAPHPSQ